MLREDRTYVSMFREVSHRAGAVQRFAAIQEEAVPMRIGILTSVPGTLDGFFPEWIDYWESLGHQVFTASGPGPQLARIAVNKHTTISRLSQNPSLDSFGAAKMIREWQTAVGVDVLIVNTATASFFSRLRRGPSPIIYFCHGLHWSDQLSPVQFVWKSLEYFSLRNTSAVVTMNSSDKTWFCGHFKMGPQVHLEYGVGIDPHQWERTPIGDPNAPIRLLWIGSFVKRKNPKAFLSLVKELMRMGIDVEGVMLGSGPLLQEAGAQARGLPIALLGQQAPLEYLKACHGLVSTSSWEGLPRVGLEACAVGRPVFGFDVKGVRDLPNSFTSDHGLGVEGLAEVIKEWQNMPNIELPDLQELSFKRSAREVLNLAKKVAGSSPASR